MKLVLVSVFVVAALAVGLLLGGVAYGGLSAFVTGAASPQDSVSQEKAVSDDNPGFRIKMSSRTGGISDDDSTGDVLPEEEDVIENETVEEDPEPVITYIGGGPSHTDKDDKKKKDPIQEVEKAVLSVEPASSEVENGTEFTVSVKISTEEKVFAAALVVGYDSDVLEYVNASEGDFFSLGGAETYDMIRHEGSLVKYDSTRLQIPEGSSGSEALLMITFRAIADGESAITIDSIELVGDDNNPVDFETEEGNVDVQ